MIGADILKKFVSFVRTNLSKNEVSGPKICSTSQPQGRIGTNFELNLSPRALKYQFKSNSEATRFFFLFITNKQGHSWLQQLCIWVIELRALTSYAVY